MNSKNYLFYLPLLCGFISSLCIGQVNFLGKPGYISTPSAAWKEQPLGFSFAFIPAEYSKNIFYSRNSSPEGDNINFYNASFKFTSFMEVSLNIAYRPSVSEVAGIGDRNLDFRFFLLKESKYRPSIVLGVTPPGSVAPMLSHDFIVITKSLNSRFGLINVSGGYGSPYIFLKNNNSSNLLDVFKAVKKENYPYASKYLSGFFGGMSYEPSQYGGIIMEYDTHTLNAGAYLKPLPWLLLQGHTFEGKEFGFSVSGNFSLDFPPRALRRYEKKLE